MGPYEILAPLGVGGMGEVYRARDKKLDRDVAIKVLPQSVAADPDTLARFEREAKAVAALSHPNILAIHDFGNQDGVTYAVMELLEGETLRGKLDAGPIPQKHAVDYALQVAKGLSAAHEKGIVHRDLKPENLFVSKDGHLKILDFGLAKRVEAVAAGKETSAPTGSGHTEPGVVMGTAGYMSPEQVKGLPVDHRSDIFSFGAILYELLSGKKAFKRDTNAETMAAILKEEPPELSASGRNVSPALDHVVKHCLEKDPGNRFQSAKDIAFALSEASGPTTSTAQSAAPPTATRKALIAAAAIFGLAAAGIFLLQRTQTGGGNAGGVKRVAVLPFENLGAAEDDYFADGIGDAVRGKLTSVPGVEVIARSSSIAYKKTAKSPVQIARELDVRYLLTATVRWQKSSGGASRVEVSPELVEVRASGAPTSKWQQPFDAALTDVFQVQSDIATRVARSLGGALGAGEEKRLAETPTANLAAYDAFLKGEEASSGLGILSPPSLRRALAFYEQAVALDPGFAQAWAQVARANAFLYTNGLPTPALAERARQAAERAVALAPNRPEGYLALGDYQRKIAKDNNRALERYAQGQLRAPGNADLLSATAMAEQAVGRWEAAVDHLRQAERLDPRSLFTVARLASVFLDLRRYPEALATCDRGLALAPASLGLVVQKALIFLAQGDLAGARDVLNAAPKEVEPTALVADVALAAGVWVLDEQRQKLLLRLKPSDFVHGNKGDWGLCLAQAYALKGDPTSSHSYAEEARRALQEQLRMAPENSGLRVRLGVVLAYLGRREEAVREAASAAKDPDNPDGYGLVYIYVLVGEPEKALDQLESLLKIPYFLSPGWLKIDPIFDPLRKNPRFQKLVAGGK